ncbi:transcriptional regulator [Halococcus saccharolyticus DSM 5350]|uniref:Transcriptional regulator n=1 Tax=Halococcus saccharolyticus DSM 5350 TaxID=1227455 RepID=M0MN33_9EURY|nr:transcriptional regulator [Halococcus saccharolyticus DSM 5350]
MLRSLLDQPHDRAELREETGASSSTLGRIIRDFIERDWIVRNGHAYEVTPMGDLVGREFTRLLDSMETVEHLHEAITWLPTEEMDLDLSGLQNASVIAATAGNPFLPVLAMAGRIGGADHVRMLASVVVPQTLAAIRDGVIEGSQSFEGVVTPSFLDALGTDTTLGGHSQEIFEADRAEIYRYEGEFPFNMAVLEDRVLIMVSDAEKMPRAMIETRNKEVLRWAESTYTSYRDQSAPLKPERPVK